MRIPPTSLSFTVLLGCLAALPVLSIDISAPTLVLLPRALGTSSTMAGLTLSVFMVGFAIGQFAGGWSSDRLGRRPVLLAGLGCYALAGVACALATSGPELIAFRLVQGVGAGACSVLAFAIVQDLFEGDLAREKRSFVSVVFGVVPVLAPAVGAWLSAWQGWRAVHGTMAIAALVLFAVIVAAFRESRSAPAVSDRAVPLVRLSSNRRFMILALINAFSYGAIFAYIAGSPVLIIEQMSLSPGAFAAIFASTALALTAGAVLSGQLSRRGVGARPLIGAGLTVAAAATVSVAAISSWDPALDVPVLLLLLVTFFCRGITAPNLQHVAVERWSDQAGAAAAGVGVSQLLAGAATSALVAALLPDMGRLAVLLPMAACAAAAAALWWSIDRPEP